MPLRWPQWPRRHGASQIGSDMRFEDWMRDEASDLLEIEGEAIEVTGDGTEAVCNVNAELAIAQPRITKDFLLHTACCRDTSVAAICGLQASRGGKSASRQKSRGAEQ
jgi:hypothetical protein